MSGPQALLDLAVLVGNGLRDSQSEPGHTNFKADGSPVGTQDLLANEILEAGLSSISDLPVLSEEKICRAEDLGSQFWLIDPLDGTKDYLAGSDEYCLLIARINRGNVEEALLHGPAKGISSYSKRGEGIKFYGPPLSESANGQGLILLESRMHRDPASSILCKSGIFSAKRKMGSSLKFHLMAAGAADVCFRLSPTFEWDIAVGASHITEVGGQIMAIESGGPLKFGNFDWRVPPWLALSSKALTHKEKILEILRECLKERVPIPDLSKNGQL